MGFIYPEEGGANSAQPLAEGKSLNIQLYYLQKQRRAMWDLRIRRNNTIIVQLGETKSQRGERLTKTTHQREGLSRVRPQEMTYVLWEVIAPEDGHLTVLADLGVGLTRTWKVDRMSFRHRKARRYCETGGGNSK